MSAMSGSGTPDRRRIAQPNGARRTAPTAGEVRAIAPGDLPGDEEGSPVAPRLDKLETAIVRTLERESRMSVLELSRQLGVSRTTISERLARLIEQGTIRGFHARVDYAWLGYPITAFVGLEVALPEHHGAIVAALRALPEVEEIHAVTGQSDLLVKVRARSAEELQLRLLPRIHAIPGTRRREVALALTTYLEGAPIGVPRDDDASIPAVPTP